MLRNKECKELRCSGNSSGKCCLDNCQYTLSSYCIKYGIDMNKTCGLYEVFTKDKSKFLELVNER